MWGLEGASLLIAIGGLVVGITITVWTFTFSGIPPVTALGYGVVPSILGIVYVFTLRENRPKSFDKDLLETLICGHSWQTRPNSKRHPLFIMLCIVFPLSAWAQFIPSQYSDVQSNTNYEFTLNKDEPYGIYVSASTLWKTNGTLHTAILYLNDEQVSILQHTWHQLADTQTTGGLSRLVQKPLKSGTKIRLKATLYAPGDPGARIFALSATPVSYDAAVNLANLERQIKDLETALQNQIHENTGKITEIAAQLANLKAEFNDFRQRFEAFNLDYSQFKVEIGARIDAIDLRISSLENDFQGLAQRFDTFQANDNKFRKDTHSRFGTFTSRISSIENQYGPLSGSIDSLDRKFSPLDQRLADLEQAQKDRKDPDLSGLDRRITRLEKRKQRMISARGHSDLLGIIGTSLGGAATLLAGASLYQSINDHAALHAQQEIREEDPQ